MGLYNCLKRRDNYGHMVLLNFNKQGETVNTSIGGFVSLIMTVVIYGFLYLKLDVMFSKGKNQVSLLEKPILSTDLGIVNGTEMNVMIYF